MLGLAYDERYSGNSYVIKYCGIQYREHEYFMPYTRLI